MALRNSPPGEWDETAVSHFHEILAALQEAFGEDLSVFRIPDERMKPVPQYVQRRPSSGRPVPPPPMSNRRNCSSDFALRQVEGVYLYLQPLVSGAVNLKASNQTDGSNNAAENRAELVVHLPNPAVSSSSRMETFLDANKPKFMYHPTKAPVRVFSRKEIEEFGPEWSETYIPQEYPKCKYHWNGKTVTVKSPEEELALGGGWANAPVFEAYKDPSRARPKDPNPLKWLDQWPPTLQSPEHQRRIKVELLKAHAAFWKSPDYPSATSDAMRQAFKGIAEVLFDAGILTETTLENDLPDLVWDSAVAGGWWHLASETPRDIFPEKVGHYWVWLDGSRDWPALFRAERTEWLARLYEMPATEANPRDAKTPEITLSYAELSKTPDSDEANVGECGPSPAAGRFPKRAAWLEDQLAIREWNVHDLRSQRGPDWKSARKVLDGIGVRRSVLEKIALALSRKKSNVRLEDIPSE